MTTENRYDPDAAPEQTPRDFYGRLTTSVMAMDYAGARAKGDAVAEAYKRYIDKTDDRREIPLWYVAAEGISVRRSDGLPFMQSELIKLVDKNGNWLAQKQAPDVFAAAFRELGVTASYAKVGQAESAVGHVFHFIEHEAKLGGGYKKGFRLWPAEIMPAGWVYDGEVRIVKPKADGDDAAPSRTPNPATGIDVNAELQATLAGRTPAEMFDAIMDNPVLRKVPTFAGQSLTATATDESLANLLAQEGVLTVGVDGRFMVPGALAAAA